jgi:hypothetical protein
MGSTLAQLLLVLCGILPACGGQNTQHNQAAEASGGTSTNNPPDIVDASVPLVVTPEAVSVPPCTRPFAPVLEAVPANAVLPVFASATDALEVAAATATQTDAGLDWALRSAVELPSVSSEVSVAARLQNANCAAVAEFIHTYSVRDAFAPGAGAPGSTAIAGNDGRFTQWATRVIEYQRGANLSEDWSMPERALGQAGDDSTAVVSLGEGGSITLGFDAALHDGDGYDFAVFENGFTDEYLELAFVEVTSDGVNFVRFDTATLVSAPVGAYGTMSPTQLEGFAGKHRVGWGTPFDLAWLRARPEVQSGLVDLARITAVRVVDIVGDGRVRDSFGHVVYDPYPTTSSAGFDLDAIGVINTSPLPASIH